MKMREEFTCPLELVHDMIKGKWKPIILWREMLKALIIMQHIGIEYLKAEGKENLLIEKGVVPE